MKHPGFIFLGSPLFAATVLDGLLAAGWSPSLVITEPPKPVGRRHELTKTAVQTLAEQRNLPVMTPATKSDLVEAVRNAQPELLVVAAYGRILPPAALEVARFGAVNVHASLLPKYRGASPIQAALLAGDTETGISFMQMEPSLDTGPVLGMRTTPIEPKDTVVSLTAKLATLAAAELPGALASYVAGKGTLQSQDHARASYAPKLTPSSGQVELSSITSLTLDRMVRAFTPWPGVYTEEFGTRLKFLDGYIDADTYVATRLQWAGKRPVDGRTFARAYPKILTSLPKTIRLEASFPATQDSVSAAH